MINELIEKKQTAELESSLIWDTLAASLAGEATPNKPLPYLSADYGELSQRQVIHALIDFFGAEKTRDRKTRKLKFDAEKLDRLGRMFELQIDIQVLENFEEINGHAHGILPPHEKST